MNEHPLILTAGPMGLPDFVTEAMCRPILHQRSDAFLEFFGALRAKLKQVFLSPAEVIIAAGSGTSGLEMAIRSFFGEGDRVLFTDFGKFSHRWAAFAEDLGIEAMLLKAEWGESPSLDMLTTLFGDTDNLQGAVLTHCETSTGTGLDLEMFAEAIRLRFPEALIIVDAVSTFGTEALYPEEWGLDVVCAAPQKGLFSPAGLALISVSERAEQRLRPAAREDAGHLSTWLESAREGAYPFTPPAALLYGLDAALDKVLEQGLPAQWNEAQIRAREFRHGIVKMGGEVKGGDSTACVTAFSFPGEDMQQLKDGLYAAGFEVSGGQGPWKGKVLRVGHFGFLPKESTPDLLQAIQELLNKGPLS